MASLTFHYSTEDRAKISGLQYPFQIMPAPRSFLKDDVIKSFSTLANDKILIHINYITRIFSKSAVENVSRVRTNLKQYAKLIETCGTKNLLIHLPSTAAEWENFENGFLVIYEELILKGVIIHFEICAPAKDLLKLEISPLEIHDKTLELATALKCENMIRFCPDTAHMFAFGLEEDDQIKLIEHYKNKIEYIHLNGNCKPKFTHDSHVPIFSSESKMSYEKLVSYLSGLKVILVTEVTKEGANRKTWEEFAEKFKLNIVPDNEAAKM